MTKEIVSVENTQSGAEDLIIASKHLLNATEQQFESIRKEKWFNRVFDMITFSQKKNILLGEQIHTLSQAQNIVLEILPRMAANHAEIATHIIEERELIENLTQNDLSLARLYKNLYQQLENDRLGVKKSQDIATLPEIDRLALSSCLRTLSQKFRKPSDLQQRYFNVIHNYISCESEGGISWDAFHERPEDARKQILQCCLEYIFLYQNEFTLSDELLEFIDNFDLGSKTVKDRRFLVSEMFHARGADGIIGKYSDNDTIEDIPDTFVIEYEEITDATVNETDMKALLECDAPENSFGWNYRLAVTGDAEAQCQVGICYFNGDGIEKNIQKAIEWYRKAAEQGHADAQNRLGVRYDRGEGIEENTTIAAAWFRKAAEQGHAKAQFNLGWAYYTGRGVSEDDTQAVYWFSQAANQGHIKAQYMLGICYLNGFGVSENQAQGAIWLRQAANHGDADAQYRLGICFIDGEGVSQDDEAGIIWLEKAAKQDHLDAQVLLSSLMIKKDLVDTAIKWIQKAASQNHSLAQYFMGMCYASGLGIEKNPVEAVFWYKKAAEQNEPNALLRLGICYIYGTNSIFFKSTGVIKDLDTAYKYLCRAIEAGENEDFLDNDDNARAHRLLAEVIYAQNVRDHFSSNALDIANCIPGVNFVSFTATGILSIAEKTKLRNFLTTEEGRIMMHHCKVAAELGDKNAIEMLKKLRKAL